LSWREAGGAWQAPNFAGSVIFTPPAPLRLWCVLAEPHPINRLPVNLLAGEKQLGSNLAGHGQQAGSAVCHAHGKTRLKHQSQQLACILMSPASGLAAMLRPTASLLACRVQAGREPQQGRHRVWHAALVVWCVCLTSPRTRLQRHPEVNLHLGWVQRRLGSSSKRSGAGREQGVAGGGGGTALGVGRRGCRPCSAAAASPSAC